MQNKYIFRICQNFVLTCVVLIQMNQFSYFYWITVALMVRLKCVKEIKNVLKSYINPLIIVKYFILDA